MNINDVNIGIGQIAIAHDFVSTKKDKCDYTNGRNKWGFIYAIDGQAVFCFKHSTYTLNKGDMAFVSPAAKYYLEVNDFRHYTVNFDLEDDDPVFPSDLNSVREKTIYVFHPTNQVKYRNLFKNICDIWQEKKYAYQIRSKALLYDVFYEFYQDLIRNDAHSDTDLLLIMPAKEYLERNWNTQFSVNCLAELCNMNPSTFRHLFTKTIRLSPLQFKNSLITTHAKDFLASGLYNISEVSQLCGFNDVNYFSRFFKTQTGISALDFKIRNEKGK